jgi:hypothetical protein
MGQPRIRMGIFGAALALGVVLLLLLLRPRVGPLRLAVSALMDRTHPPAAAPASGAGALPAAAGKERSELADGLNSPSGDVHADLRLIDQVFIAYRQALHTGNPVGENAEITAALTGRNKLGFAFIPADNSAINTKGELCDRWGTPYFFHQLSGEKMEIRSAGPDRRLWNADDVVFTP